MSGARHNTITGDDWARAMPKARARRRGAAGRVAESLQKYTEARDAAGRAVMQGHAKRIMAYVETQFAIAKAEGHQ